MISDPVFVFDQVSYCYPLAKKPALREVSCVLQAGKVYGVTGSNGSGKTTFCNLLRGLIPYFYKGELSGSVTVLGQEIREWTESDLAVQIGYVFQNPFTQISGVKETVFEEVGIGLENLGVPRDEMIDRILTVCKQLHIEDLIEKNPMELSGGQCQRVAFASIVAMDCPVLVIDEPTSQLDPKGTQEVFEIIRILKEMGKTIILVEHKIDLLAQYCDELLILQDGELRAIGPVREVFAKNDLREWDAAIPYTVELYYALKERGLDLPRVPIYVDEWLEMHSNEAGGPR